MGSRQDFKKPDCWYKEVCQLKSCDNCVRYLEMKYLVENSGIPKNRQYPEELVGIEDYEAFTKLSKIKEDIVNFVNAGSNLYICSNYTGNGKTSWSIKLMLKYFNEIWAGNGFRVRGLFIHVPTLLNQLKNFNHPVSEEYRENIINADLVIWDDIANNGLSSFDLMQLLIYIDQRIFIGKCNIFTGNITEENEFANTLGDRLTSRIYRSGTVIKFIGKDRRNL